MAATGAVLLALLLSAPSGSAGDRFTDLEADADAASERAAAGRGAGAPGTDDDVNSTSSTRGRAGGQDSAWNRANSSGSVEDLYGMGSMSSTRGHVGGQDGLLSRTSSMGSMSSTRGQVGGQDGLLSRTNSTGSVENQFGSPHPFEHRELVDGETGTMRFFIGNLDNAIEELDALRDEIEHANNKAGQQVPEIVTRTNVILLRFQGSYYFDEGFTEEVNNQLLSLKSEFDSAVVTGSKDDMSKSVGHIKDFMEGFRTFLRSSAEDDGVTTYSRQSSSDSEGLGPVSSMRPMDSMSGNVGSMSSIKPMDSTGSMHSASVDDWDEDWDENLGVNSMGSMSSIKPMSSMAPVRGQDSVSDPASFLDANIHQAEVSKRTMNSVDSMSSISGQDKLGFP